MSYCVQCGVELEQSARRCPLCGTPVNTPNCPPAPATEPFFPVRNEEVEPVSRRQLGLLLTAMLASVAICCGLLNLVLHRETWWFLFVAGAAVMLWVWFALPLLLPKPAIWLRLILDVAAVGIYVYLIAIALGGMDWYVNLALPILLGAAIVLPLLSWLLWVRHCSILTSVILVLLSVGLLTVVVELFSDLYLHGAWGPGWSLVVMAVCVGLSVPLIVVQRVPALREEVRRRFHM